MLREFAHDTRLISWRACRCSAAKVLLLLAVLLSLIALSACISTFEVSPERRQGSGLSYPIQTHVTFQIAPDGTGPSRDYGTRADFSIGHSGTPGIRKVFEESFASATYVQTTWPTGTHVHIEVEGKPSSNSELSLRWAFLIAHYLFVLPSYLNDYGYAVYYNLYINEKFERTYRYELTQKKLLWLPLALFVWVNYFTTGETDAFEETARQFVVDAERDGYVRHPRHSRT